ncbi:uroporphyrinogen decarboxylase [Parvularcula dongshanensis]|uniref:Uroporphyrinogen decarboxylase n=1 Tax=Parvularcula dongshanensis TaxID=1173995 RepID=A0A840HYW6_9PROT|nr:uroporphyrinogen decarboxylase [Parvularcula dongshanensis]MBB4658036.1 uroporphyrinogen decarboxylase [Parvularcula dongshanensis]
MADGQGRFLETLSGRAVKTPPIWFMRQAGRYLPEYRAVRAKAGSFLDLCYAPELAAEVTLQPIRRYDLDAAILFADILLIPQALGQDVRFEKGEGPRLSPAFATAPEALPRFLDAAAKADLSRTLSPVYETVRLVRAGLARDKALIGFAGAPWTVATYMLAGRGVKDPSALRLFAYENEDDFARLMERLTSATADYLIEQGRAGVDAVQLFDSWASGLPEDFFRRWCLAPCEAIAERVKAALPGLPVIAFPRGAGPLYEAAARSPLFDAVGIDTGVPPLWAAERLSPQAVVQGNLDPLLVVRGGAPMLRAADAILDAFEGKPHVFNLGHGFVPQTPPEHVAELVAHIRERG